MKILVTNDDGINSYGLKILVDVARQFGEVFCIAPMTEQSGKSHSIIIKDPIQILQEKDIVEGVRTYSVNGTPGDCVRIAYYYLKEEYVKTMLIKIISTNSNRGLEYINKFNVKIFWNFKFN